MQMRTMFMTLALGLSPVALAAQEAPVTAEARVDAALRTATEAGLPVSLLESKIAQGKARGVPMERLAAAVEARLQALTQAREAFARAQVESATEGEFSIAADAVAAGVSQTALVTISQTAPQERRAVAIAVLADLVALGHASDRAVVQVQSALARGPDALADLRAESSAQLQARGVSGAAIPAEAGARIELRAARPGS